jgi:hypothetical protein
MSDSLPEHPLSGILRVLKLNTGEEIIGLVNETSLDKITVKLPALLQNYYAKENNSVVEYVKLTNYISNIKSFEINLNRSVIIYSGQPTIELEKMYEVFFLTMQTDPKAIVGNGDVEEISENGLQLLNDLFNNEDFVNFVNDLIENFEGVEILVDEDEEFEDDGESGLNAITPPEEEPTPKPKKKKKTKPEASKMPYNPELPPTDPESWSDNPADYL